MLTPDTHVGGLLLESVSELVRVVSLLHRMQNGGSVHGHLEQPLDLGLGLSVLLVLSLSF